MKIGNLQFEEKPLFLAPMEDVTDIGFRRICRQQGAAMVYSEFVAAEALVRSVKSTLDKLTVCDEERPVGIQIYGRDADAVVEAARIVESEAYPDVIDLNFGCPVKKVAGKGAGAGMLRNIPLMLDITRRVVAAVRTPVTVKTRLGWDAENIVITTLAEQLQDCGIQALTIHGRTRSQMYTGTADWTLIGEVKNNPRISIPIIGNGDITSLDEADEAFRRYGVDAVMVGRATFGCPWFFNRRPLSLDDKFALLRRQLEINVSRLREDAERRGSERDKSLAEMRGILHTRRHLAATPIFKGIPDFRQTRVAMLRADTLADLLPILDEAERRLKEMEQ
ncbi:MAG: tRNA-dihydrouridine synthase family protein [Bacteroidales bacterium]|nr:tRNA-dihydrouridine synthase family protein [Bacteroidales bacterium]